MRFSTLALYLEKLEQTTSRNTITETLAQVFKKAEPSEIDKICYLLLGRIAPAYKGIEFNFAERMMLRAIASAYGVDQARVLRMYKDKGDLGEVTHAIANSKFKIQNSKLSVKEVYKKFYEVATENGAGSQERKLKGICELLENSDPLSSRYITRIPVGKLRLGFSEMTILDALSVMKVGDKKARKSIEAAYNVVADIGKIAHNVKVESIQELEKTRAIPGIPIRAALAERLENAEKIIEKVGPKVAIEPKYDGLRIAVHIWGKGRKREVRLFSRNQENVTEMFPEICEAVVKLSAESVIFDGEAIGYNPKTGKFYPFQETVQRKRKYGISEILKTIPLKVFVFDVLHLNGQSLIEKPFEERREVLEKVLGKKMNTIVLTEQQTVDNASDFRRIANNYLGEGLEGAMAKKLDEPYRAGGRGFHWVKYKKHTEGTPADTIDCVLMGAYVGRGKRATFGAGAFLLGVVGGEKKYYTISNLGTGLTDEQFREVYKIVQNLKIEKKPDDYVVDKTIEPDIWLEPKVVLEILADEITRSPRHTAKYSLRFPRLIRVRDDKDPDQGTSVSEIKSLYKMQKR
ncbi:MAG: ATP-dependent DNA ligase [Candidatus Blackburnbacteria bacterium]|nr:ATP-dependent DNA ligase [Candidatus Blackburnbacteria bacterium]